MNPLGQSSVLSPELSARLSLDFPESLRQFTLGSFMLTLAALPDADSPMEWPEEELCSAARLPSSFSFEPGNRLSLVLDRAEAKRELTPLGFFSAPPEPLLRAKATRLGPLDEWEWSRASTCCGANLILPRSRSSAKARKKKIACSFCRTLDIPWGEVLAPFELIHIFTQYFQLQVNSMTTLDSTLQGLVLAHGVQDELG